MTIQKGVVANNQSQNMQVAKTGGFDIVKMSGFTRDKIDLIKQTVAKNTTDTELAYFLQVAKEVNLSPFTKEIWCYKDNRGNVLVFAGRDGFRSIAQRNDKFVDMNSVEVCAKDKFKMGLKDGKPFIEHEFSGEYTTRGDIIGAYCVINLSNGGKIVEWADIRDYDKKQFTWSTHKAEMIRKVAEIHAVKKMSNIRGIYAEEEFTINNGVVVDTDPAPVKTNADELKAEPQAEAEPELITGDMMITLQDEIARVGKSTEGLLEYLKKDKIEQITFKEATAWITALSKMPNKKEEIVVPKKPIAKPLVRPQAQVIEGEVIEIEDMPPPEPKPGLEMLRATANKIKQRRTLSKVAPPEPKPKYEVITDEVWAVVEKIDEKYRNMPTACTAGELQLLDDCGTEKFKGREAYKIEWDITKYL